MGQVFVLFIHSRKMPKTTWKIFHQAHKSLKTRISQGTSGQTTKFKGNTKMAQTIYIYINDHCIWQTDSVTLDGYPFLPFASIYPAKLQYFTNLDFPDIRKFPFQNSYLLGALRRHLPQKPSIPETRNRKKTTKSPLKISRSWVQ